MATIVEFKEIPLGDLTFGLGQVRLRDVSKEIDELADSIRRVGLLEPIVVCPTEQPSKYEIITGQRRFLAHQELGKDTIWAAVLDEKIDEITAKVLSVTENLVRCDLHSTDLIDVCTYLYNRYGTLQAVSKETGLAYEKVRKYVKYDQLEPQLQRLVDSGEVKLATALRAQQAASVLGVINIEEAVQFAKDMSPMSGVQQTAIVKERKSNPTRPVDDIIEDAKSGAKLTQINVTLTSGIHSALGQYAESQDTNINDAAGLLIQQGLFVNDFLEDIS